MVIVIGLKFYLAQSLYLCVTFEVKGFILCVIEFFVPRLFEEKWRDTVFGFPWGVVRGAWCVARGAWCVVPSF